MLVVGRRALYAYGHERGVDVSLLPTLLAEMASSWCDAVGVPRDALMAASDALDEHLLALDYPPPIAVKRGGRQQSRPI